MNSLYPVAIALLHLLTVPEARAGSDEGAETRATDTSRQVIDVLDWSRDQRLELEVLELRPKYCGRAKRNEPYKIEIGFHYSDGAIYTKNIEDPYPPIIGPLSQPVGKSLVIISQGGDAAEPKKRTVQGTEIRSAISTLTLQLSQLTAGLKLKQRTMPHIAVQLQCAPQSGTAAVTSFYDVVQLKALQEGDRIEQEIRFGVPYGKGLFARLRVRLLEPANP